MDSIDRNGNPLSEGDPVRIPVRQVRPMTVEYSGEHGYDDVIFVYPEVESPIEYLTGLILETDDYDGSINVRIDGTSNPKWLESVSVERTS